MPAVLTLKGSWPPAVLFVGANSQVEIEVMLTDPANYPRSRRGTRLLLIAGGLLLPLAVFAVVISNNSAGVPNDGDPAVLWETELVEQPPVIPAPATPAKAGTLSDSAFVIGVTVGGHSRAYAISAMSNSAVHVLNDMIDDTPVTVAYCDRTDCARGYTAKGRQVPLDVAVGGWYNAGGVAGMVVRTTGHNYLLHTASAIDADAPPFPYDPIDVRVCTWGEWYSAHPNTDVFLGGVRKHPTGG